MTALRFVVLAAIIALMGLLLFHRHEHPRCIPGSVTALMTWCDQ